MQFSFKHSHLKLLHFAFLCCFCNFSQVYIKSLRQVYTVSSEIALSWGKLFPKDINVKTVGKSRNLILSHNICAPFQTLILVLLPCVPKPCETGDEANETPWMTPMSLMTPVLRYSNKYPVFHFFH